MNNSSSSLTSSTDDNVFGHFSTKDGHHRFVVSRVKSDADRAEVYAFMQNTFRLQEPITRAIQCTASDTSHIYENICAGCFKDDVSLMVRDSNGTLAGIALNAISEFNGTDADQNGGGEGAAINGEAEEEALEEKGPKKFEKEIRAGPYASHNANRLATFISLVERRGIDHKYAQKRVMKVDILAVHPAFARMGLASHLLHLSIQLARSSAHCSHLISCATAVASQNLFRKFGFQTIRTVPFADFLDNGVPIYITVPDKGVGAELMVLQI